MYALERKQASNQTFKLASMDKTEKTYIKKSEIKLTHVPFLDIA